MISIPITIAVVMIALAIQVARERMREAGKPRPLYFVQHPDGTFSMANPQP